MQGHAMLLKIKIPGLPQINVITISEKREAYAKVSKAQDDSKIKQSLRTSVLKPTSRVVIMLK